METPVKPFIVAGMPRGGTTFLYHNLKKHPGVFLPFRKEVNYFGSNFARGEDWYRGLYTHMKPGLTPGDISPPYFMNDHAAQRILDYNPDVKVILVVRDPVEWALSFYEQMSTLTLKIDPFENFVAGKCSYSIGDEMVQLRFANNFLLNRVSEYKRFFGKNLLIYDFDFFAKDRRAVLMAMEKFLGLDPFFAKGEFDDVKINASNRKNSRWLSFLLSRELVISSIHKALPLKLITYGRSWFDRASARDEECRADELTNKARNRDLAESLLGDQRQGVAELFARSPIVLGDGVPFEHALTHQSRQNMLKR